MENRDQRNIERTRDSLLFSCRSNPFCPGKRINSEFFLNWIPPVLGGIVGGKEEGYRERNSVSSSLPTASFNFKVGKLHKINGG